MNLYIILAPGGKPVLITDDYNQAATFGGSYQPLTIRGVDWSWGLDEPIVPTLDAEGGDRG